MIQPQLGFSPHNNQSLFSDHYLQEILRRTPAWRALQTPAAEFLTWLRQLYATEREQLANYNESQLEDNWFKPILTQLRHVWEGQASIPGLKGNIKKPDFALFPDEAARQTAVSQQNSPDYTKDVLALVEAKKWTVNLSKKSGPQPIFADQNPMYQIDTYLSLSGVEWGVVSNGRFWRLVHKNSSRTLETYFEIDLLAALHAPEDSTAGLAVATFFWAFFNQGAFRADAHGTVFLDEALSQSKAYAIALEADLRDNAYRSLEQLIIGFFAGDGRLDPQNAEHRDEVYRNSLYLLYRLLFLFYGEARALLPMGNNTYKNEYSLQTLANDINRERDKLETLPTTGRRRWNRLTELFRLISGEDAQLNAELGVPRYNGGLFDPTQHPFFGTYFVGDRALAQAIDYLAYRRVREDGRFQGFQSVDYRTLDVRQLGSIYEGLLEYKVAVATEEMVTVRQKGVETWVPQAQKGRSQPIGTPRRPGDLYLTTDKGERKATGSYYTPDYIVEYIVENTLGPLVAQARERVKAQVRQTGSLDKAERQRQSAALFVQEILALNVLDPAMGSGHFLVEATNFLARALATDEYVTPEGSGRPLAEPATSQLGESGTVRRPATAQDGGETDLLYWKRRVVEACIYGVDKNPMAVELAKLSLWLKTAAADKPLSFLDHHLQHGDSLIGAWLDDLRAAPGSRPQGFAKGSSPAKTTGSKPLGSDAQQPLLDESAFTRDINRAVADVMTIERLPTLDIDDVHAKETTWQQIRQTHVARWQRLADLWVSAYFGNTMTPEEYRALAAHLESGQLQGQESLLSEAQLNHFLQHPSVDRQDNAIDYFHWELAFPEVFFDEYGNHRRDAAGFDAVIGNPPYVRQEQLQNNKHFYKAGFQSFDSSADLYVYFIELALKLSREAGLSGFITSNKFMRSNYGQSVRSLLVEDALLKKIIDFGELPIFEAAATFPAILLFAKSGISESERAKYQVRVAKVKTVNPINLHAQVEELFYQSKLSNFGGDLWTLASTATIDVLEKLSFETQLLKDFINGSIYFGVKTGFNEAFFISHKAAENLIAKEPESARFIKKLIVGDDVRKYFINYAERFLIVIPNGWTSQNYAVSVEDEAWLNFERDHPALASHLAEFKDKARKRTDQGEFWWELRPCDYYDLIEKPKIVYPDIAKESRFSFDVDGHYPVNTIYFIPSENHFLLGLLNSRLLFFFMQQKSAVLGDADAGGRLRFFTQYVENIPICKIEFETPIEERTAVVNTAKTHYEQGNTAALLAWAAAELAANRNDTIHDLLAHLAEQMIALNQQKQAALEAFWLDLEGVTDAKPFDTLRNKGKWEQSLHKNVPAARAFVDEASRSTITLDATLGWNEDAFKGMVKELVGSISGLSKLVQVYREHAPSVAALNQRLITTDHLIDQIVYKLYNLTPAEIAIVEGKDPKGLVM